MQAAQKAAGEVLWLTTKTRPDLMFVTSRMSSAVTKEPRRTVELGKQVRKYLHKTVDMGLWFERNVGEGITGLNERRLDQEED